MAGPRATEQRDPGGRKTNASKGLVTRSVQRKIRYTVDEDIAVRRSAEAAGLTVAEFTRRRSLGTRVVARVHTSDPRLIHELNAIGVNLNQISRNLNSGRLGVAGSRLDDLDELMSRLRDTLDRAVEGFDD